MNIKYISRIGFAAIATVISACNGTTTPTDGGGDTISDTGADIVTHDTGDAAPTPDVVDTGTDTGTDTGGDAATDGGDGGPSCTFTRAIIGTSDYDTFGGFVVADFATHTFMNVPASSDGGTGVVYQDHNVHTAGCGTFDLENDTPSTANALNPANLATPLFTVTLDSLPSDSGMTNSNPYDIVQVDATHYYVLQYDSTQIAIVDGTHAVTGHIDLSQFAVSSSVPRMATMTLVGHYAYVALQQLDDSYDVPTHSHLAVIDTTTNMLVDVDPTMPGVQAIQLTYSNPQAYMPLDSLGTHLLVAEPGDYVLTDGGVDIIDTTTNTVFMSVGHAALGGDPTSVVALAGTTAWASVDVATDAATTHEIVAFDTHSGTVTATPVVTSADYQYTGLRLAPDGTIWAIGGDYDMGSVHVFNTSGTEIAGPYLTGSLNTTSLAFLP